MDRFRVELEAYEAEERRELRAAFIKGTIADFRGRPVRVWGEFVTDGAAAYQVEPVDDGRPAMADQRGEAAPHVYEHQVVLNSVASD